MNHFLTFFSTGWALPSAAAVQVWWMMGWALVAGALVRRWTRSSVGGALVFVVLSIPGMYAPLGYWALAFQSPSAVLVVWALWQFRTPLSLSVQAQTAHDENSKVPTGVLLCWIALGWLLCLETFQVWPHSWPSVFAWGFEPASLWAVLLVGVATVWRSSRINNTGFATWHLQALVVLLVYVCLRLPTGNLWDALLDPWVWVGAHVLLIRGSAKRASALAHHQILPPK